MFNYLQVKHSKTQGEVLGQTLTFNTRDEWLLEYHSKMKNAINDPDTSGMSILVVDSNLRNVFEENWVREVPEDKEKKTQNTEQTQAQAEE